MKDRSFQLRRRHCARRRAILSEWIPGDRSVRPLITEHHLTVRKTARYCVLGELSPATTDLWIVCHGFGQLAREFLSGFEAIARPGRAVVAPEGLSRFYKSQRTVHTPDTPVGATWMTSEDRQNEINDYVAYLDALVAEIRSRVSPNVRVTALGFSQGAATVSRWVAGSKPSLVQLVLWGGLLPPEFTEHSSLGGLVSQPLRFVMGTTDRYIKTALVDSEIERMHVLGIPASVTRFEGGHIVDSVALKRIADQG